MVVHQQVTQSLTDSPSVLTILPHLSISDLNSASACCCDETIGSKPRSTSFFCTAGVLTVSLIAEFSVAGNLGSVLAGAEKPDHEAAVKFGKPCSA